MFKKISLIVCLSLALAGCSHTRVPVYRAGDPQLTSREIKTEMCKLDGLIKEIQSKRGFSGRNIAMGLLFWPGIIVNEYNASDALKVAEKRMTVLTRLYEKRQKIENVQVANNQD